MPPERALIRVRRNILLRQDLCASLSKKHLNLSAVRLPIPHTIQRPVLILGNAAVPPRQAARAPDLRPLMRLRALIHFAAVLRGIAD